MRGRVGSRLPPESAPFDIAQAGGNQASVPNAISQQNGISEGDDQRIGMHAPFHTLTQQLLHRRRSRVVEPSSPAIIVNAVAEFREQRGTGDTESGNA